MERKLRLKKELLSELATADLVRVVGAGGGVTENCTQAGCTLPLNQCVLSLGDECDYSDYQGCQGSLLVCT